MPHFVLNNPRAIANACKIIQGASEEHPLEVTILPYSKKRTVPQNRLMWKSVMGDFTNQGILNGRTFTQKIWHEQLKELFLPETFVPGKTCHGYEKYSEMPDGRLKMTGSTTDLTVSGMSDYLEQCYVYGIDLGIRFTTNKY